VAVIDDKRRLHVWDVEKRVELSLETTTATTPATFAERPFAGDGTLFVLRRVQASVNDPRGELLHLDPATGKETFLGRAAFSGLRTDLARRRFSYVGEGPPEGATMLWLLEAPGSAPVPVRSDVAGKDHLVGAGWLAFVRKPDDGDAGLYLTHYPRDLPAASEPDLPAEIE
jgi:hypothetical protein